MTFMIMCCYVNYLSNICIYVLPTAIKQNNFLSMGLQTNSRRKKLGYIWVRPFSVVRCPWVDFDPCCPPDRFKFDVIKI